MKKFSKKAIKADTASLQDFAAVLKADIEHRMAQKFGTISAAADPYFLRKAGRELFNSALRPSKAMQANATDARRMSQSLVTLFRVKSSSSVSLNESVFLQSSLA